MNDYSEPVKKSLVVRRAVTKSDIFVGAALVAARIGRRPMTIIALARDPGRDEPCPYQPLATFLQPCCGQEVSVEKMPERSESRQISSRDM